MTDDDLAALDARAARSRRALASTTGAGEVPPWQPPRRRDRRLLAVAVVVAIALVGVAGVMTSGDRDVDSMDVAAGGGYYFAPTETLGLPLRRAVRGDEIPATDSPHLVVVYGADPDFRGPGVTVVAQESSRPFDIRPGAEDERVIVGDSEGLLSQQPGSPLWNLTWEPEESVLVHLTAKDLDRSVVLEVASKVTVGSDGEPALADPEAFGLQEIIRGRADEVFPGPAGGGFQPDGTMLRYGHQDGSGRQLTLVTGSGDDRMLKAHRLVYPLADDIEINGSSALIAPITTVAEPLPGEPTVEVSSWVVVWQPDEGTVLSVMGFDLSRDEVTAVAESVRPIGPDAFQRLAESDDYDPDDELPGLEPARTVIVRGTLAGGEAWRLDAPDPESGAPIAVRFTWTRDGSSTGSEVQASSDGAPLLLATRTTNVDPEHVYGFSSTPVERLRWEAPDGGGGSLTLRDIGDARGRYFVEPLPEDAGTITLIAEDGEGGELGRFEMTPEATVESGMATTTTVG